VRVCAGAIAPLCASLATASEGVAEQLASALANLAFGNYVNQIAIAAEGSAPFLTRLLVRACTAAS
jgi:hypothetical protein